jgi:hypothetical protein
VATLPGPVPLPVPIDDRVEEQRHLFCTSYDACLGLAAREDWSSWTCAHCARFRRLRPSRVPEPGRPTANGRRREVAGPEPAAPPDARAGTGTAPATPAAAARPKDAGSRQRVSHRLVPESGLLRIRLEAPSVTALFVEAARAVAEVVCGRPLDASEKWVEDVALEAPSAELLLVAWIAELLRRSIESRVRFEECDVVYLSERQIVASIRGVRLRELRTPIRQAACHDPALVQRPGHVSASPVLDV